MKQTHLFVAAILVCGLAVGSRANAQTTKNISFITDVKSLEKVLSLHEPNSMINTKAMRDFKKTYPNVDGEKWYSFKDGFAAKFSEDGIQHMVTYNRIGDWLYTISYYDEKQLPSETRAMVKGTYYDYKITLVEEITLRQQTIYLVHIEDETTWKTVRVSDSEMTVIEDFNKK
jgi:hypothetical protein